MVEISDQWAFVFAYGLLIFMKIICFVLGFLTIYLGYRLILSGVKGEFKFSAQLGGVKTDLASLSPGLLFVLLGVLLIGYSMYVEKEVVLEKKQPKNPPEIALPPDTLIPNLFKETEDENK